MLLPRRHVGELSVEVDGVAQGLLRGLTFELSGRQRQDARPGLAKMYRVPPGRAWWPAVGAPLERGVCAQHGRELMGCKSPVGVPTWTHREQG